MGAHHRHVAGVVEDAVLLLVGGIVLLVDDDQAELAKRQEQRRTRTGDHTDAPVGDLPPDLFARLRREVGMPFGGRRAKAAMKALQECLRQRDLGQQDEHLFSLFQRRGDRLEIDLGLAGTGYAFQQCRRKASFRGPGAQSVGGRPLVARQVGGVVIRVGYRDDRHRRQLDLRQTSPP